MGCSDPSDLFLRACVTWHTSLGTRHTPTQTWSALTFASEPKEADVAPGAPEEEEAGSKELELIERSQ
jgi:hypothetical protein